MRPIRRIPILAGALAAGAVCIAGATPTGAQPLSQASGPQAPGTQAPGPQAPDAAIDPEVLRLREAAWRAWFAGDETTLRSLLPPEFIGIDMDDGPFSSLEKTLADARAFRAGGSRLVRLEFPETRAQRMGEVLVLYGRFSVVLESGGKERTFSGRLTEVFVRREGRWWHPGWHLDLASTPVTPTP
jgi:hypothetical protein